MQCPAKAGWLANTAINGIFYRSWLLFIIRLSAGYGNTTIVRLFSITGIVVFHSVPYGFNVANPVRPVVALLAAAYRLSFIQFPAGWRLFWQSAGSVARLA